MQDPDLVAVETQLNALVHEPLRCAVETTTVAQVAVERHPRRPMARPLEPRWRQRSQRLPLLAEPLLNDEAASRVPPPVADPVAPVGVLLVETAERLEAAGRPEAALEVADAGFDGALLARARRRACGRVEAVVAAQVQEAPIP